jgi:hypothetical protein
MIKPQSRQDQYEEAQTIAKALEKVWNSLCKEAGWPHRKSSGECLRNTKVIRCCIRYGGDYVTKGRPESLEPPLRWILSRWNWGKSPAPLNLLASPTQWKAYDMVMARLEEENSEANKDKESNLVAWARMEMNNRLRRGMTPSEARQSVEEFAQVLGKTKGLTPQQMLDFRLKCAEMEESA